MAPIVKMIELHIGPGGVEVVTGDVFMRFSAFAPPPNPKDNRNNGWYIRSDGKLLRLKEAETVLADKKTSEETVRLHLPKFFMTMAELMEWFRTNDKDPKVFEICQMAVTITSKGECIDYQPLATMPGSCLV